jgi:PASTA domain
MRKAFSHKRKVNCKMAQYTIGVPYCFIRAIRSLSTDTLAASMGLRVLNAQGALHHDLPAQSAINLGDHTANTNVSINLFYQDVDVPDPTPQFPDGGSISWSFILTNSGHTDSSALVGALNNAANAVVGAFVGSGDITAEVAAGAIIGVQTLLQLLTANCDGVVAAVAVSLTAAELAQMTTGPINWAHLVNCPGTDSSVGCGGNSNYDVHYVIANRSLVTVPDLSGKSPAVAQQLVQQAGLLFSSASSRTGGPREAPHVEGQNPAPGSQVLPGTWVEAFIILPTPSGHPVP